MLYLVPTPVGNLEDITLRALRVIREADVLLAEDTRVSRRLLDHYEIKGAIRSYHAHNEHRVVEGLVRELSAGVTMALLSDAGTPGISDAGFLLVRACHDAAVPVFCLPGPTSLIPALVQSGLPCDRFHFEGFLPHKKGRQTRLKWLAAYPYSAVLFESPTRLVRLLDELITHCGPEHPAAVVREISKIHEETRTGTLASLKEHYSSLDRVRGEIVVVIGGAG
jgi:16S rRNA (cytidine1402-2'-O)-methyltransferase